MLQPNISKRKLSFVNVWVSVALIIATIVMTFMPMISLSTGDKIDTINDYIEEFTESDLVIPETVEISVPKLIGSISVITKIVEVAGGEASEETLDELDKIIDSKDGKETVVMMAAFIATILDGVDFENMNGIGDILSLVVTMVSLLYVLVFTFVLPILFIIKGLIAIIRALCNIKTPEKVSAKIGRVLPRSISLPLMYLLFQSFIPGMKYGMGALLILVLGLVSVAFGAVLARLRSYDAADLKYSLVLQGTSAVAFAGFAIFFFSIIKTNIFSNFVTGPWANIMAAAESTSADIGSWHIVSAVLIFLATVTIFASVKHLRKLTGRFGLNMKSRRGRASDFALVDAIALVLAYVLPVVVAGQTHDYSMLGYGKKLTFLTFLKAEESALTMALVGIIIMVVAEIALIILKKVLCKGMSKESMVAVMTGNAKTLEEKAAEAAAAETVDAPVENQETAVTVDAPADSDTPKAEDQEEDEDDEI